MTGATTSWPRRRARRRRCPSPTRRSSSAAGRAQDARLVAQYANACNLFASSPEEIAHKLDVLRGHCDAGRDEAEIGKTILYVAPTLAGGDRDAFLADMADYAGLGISEAVVMPPTGRPMPGSSRCVRWCQGWPRSDPGTVPIAGGLRRSPA